MLFGAQILSPLALSLTRNLQHADWFSFSTRHKDERVGVSFIHGHSCYTSLLSQDTFLLPSPVRNGFSGLTWRPGLSDINSNSGDISSGMAVISWLLYIIFILFSGSVSLVSPKSAPTRAEWSSRISSPIFGIFTHITAEHHGRDSLSHTLQLILFQSSGVTQCSLVKFCKMMTNFQMQITCCRHKLCKHRIPPPWF